MYIPYKIKRAQEYLPKNDIVYPLRMPRSQDILKEHSFCLWILMASSKPLIDNNFLTIALDIYVLYTELFSFLSSFAWDQNWYFCQLWIFIDRKKWFHRSRDIKGLPQKTHLGFWNFLVVWLSFRKDIKG